MLIRASRLETTPVPQLVRGMIPELGVGLVYGPEESGKSLVMFSMGMAIANERQFFDREVKGGSIVYCLGEGSGDAGIRLRALVLAAAWSGITLSTSRFVIEDEPFSLPSQLDVNQKIREWAVIPDLQLVVIDVLRYFTGNRSPENPTSAAIMVKAAKRISRERNCTVILVHHTGKNGDVMSGAASLSQLSDFRIRIDNGSIQVERQKTSKKGDPIGFAVQDVGWDDPEEGERVETAIIRALPRWDDDDDGEIGIGISTKQVAAGIMRKLALEYGFGESLRSIAIEQGIPLRSVGLDNLYGDEVDDEEVAEGIEAPDRDEIPETAIGLPVLITGDELNGRPRKRTGIKPAAAGRLAIG